MAGLRVTTLVLEARFAARPLVIPQPAPPTMPTTMPTIVARKGASLVAGGSPANAHTPPNPTLATQSRTRMVIQPRLDMFLDVTGRL